MPKYNRKIVLETLAESVRKNGLHKIHLSLVARLIADILDEQGVTDPNESVVRVEAMIGNSADSPEGFIEFCEKIAAMQEAPVEQDAEQEKALP